MGPPARHARTPAKKARVRRAGWFRAPCLAPQGGVHAGARRVFVDILVRSPHVLLFRLQR